MELEKIDPEKYGLEEMKAEQIRSQFQPMLDKMVELEKEANEVFSKPIDEDTCKLAKEVRLKFVKVRTGTAKVHKEQKAFYLAAGKFIDGWKNTQKFASEGVEKRLLEIEKYYENLELQKIKELRESREEELKSFDVEVIPEGLGVMDDAIWDNYIQGVKTNHKLRKEAEEKSRLEQEEKERKAKLHESRKNKVLHFWFLMNDEEKQLDFSDFTNDEFDQFYQDFSKQKENHDLDQKKIKEENERLKREQEEKEAEAKRQRELEAKKLRKLEEEKKALELEAENKRKAEKEKEELELSKKDSDKVKALINDVTELKLKYSFKSKKNKVMFDGVCSLLEKVIHYIQTNS